MTSVEIWENVHKSRQWGTCPEPAVARWAMRTWGGLDKDAKGRIKLLEVGCGVGAQAFWLVNNGFLVDAIDASPSAIERAGDLYGNIFPHSLRFYHMRTDNLPVDCPVKYDGVVDVCCLQHVETLGDSISACAQMLKPGGRMLSIIAADRHSPILAGSELDGAVFHRLGTWEIYDWFSSKLFSEVHLEQSCHTDKGKFIAHWVVEAVKAP